MPYLRVKNELPLIPGYASGDIASFEAAAAPLVSCICTINPVQSGSGDPSPSNVRPITGHTELNLVHTGANLWDEKWENGYIDTDGSLVNSGAFFRSKNLIPVNSLATYYFKNTLDSQGRICYYDQNGTYLGRSATNTISNQTFTVPNGCSYIKFYVSGSTNNKTVSINYPSTDTSYHAYTGSTTTTDLGTTVYGGTLEVVSGVLTIDRAFETVSNLNWGYTSGKFYSTNTLGMLKTTGKTIISDTYKTVDNIGGSASTMDDMSVCCINNPSGLDRIYITDSNYTDETTFKSARASTQLCFRLATPTTTQLTPQEVKSLLGSNNFYHDGNGPIDITYIRRIN